MCLDVLKTASEAFGNLPNQPVYGRLQMPQRCVYRGHSQNRTQVVLGTSVKLQISSPATGNTPLTPENEIRFCSIFFIQF